jgi:hypothetical protein
MTLPLSIAHHMFLMHTDGHDINDESVEDIVYKFVDPNEPNASNVDTFWKTEYSPAEAYMLENAQISYDANGPITMGKVGGVENNKLKYDWVRYEAVKLFGSAMAADLFSNEEDVREHLSSTADLALRAKFAELLAFQETNSVEYEHNGGLHYSLVANNKDMCPSYQIMSQIRKRNVQRLIDYTEQFYTYDEARDPIRQNPIGPYFIPVPLMVGDEIAFKVTISAAPNQLSILDYFRYLQTGNNATSTVDSVIPPHSFLIRVKLVADPVAPAMPAAVEAYSLLNPENPEIGGYAWPTARDLMVTNHATDMAQLNEARTALEGYRVDTVVPAHETWDAAMAVLKLAQQHPDLGSSNQTLKDAAEAAVVLAATAANLATAAHDAAHEKYDTVHSLLYDATLSTAAQTAVSGDVSFTDVVTGLAAVALRGRYTVAAASGAELTAYFENMLF